MKDFEEFVYDKRNLISILVLNGQSDETIESHYEKLLLSRVVKNCY